MIFDIKMEDFCCKACLVAGGHMSNVPAMYSHSSVVAHETICISLMLAAMSLLDVVAAEIINTYFTAQCKEKIWTTLCFEFGKDKGKKAISIRALYGLESADQAI